MSSVFKCHHLETGVDVAVKVVQMHSAPEKTAFQHEVEYLREFGHGDCIDFLGATEVMASVKTRYGYLVTQLADGTLEKKVLKLPFETVSPETRFGLAIEIVRALQGLHAQGCMHRDVKPENIAIIGDCASPGPGGCHAKLLDFGLCTTERLQHLEHSTHLGTLRYLAPEVWKSGIHSDKSDVWSAGLVLFEMLSGSQPLAYLSEDLAKKESQGTIHFKAALNEMVTEEFDLPKDPNFRKFIEEDHESAAVIATMINREEGLRPGFDEVLMSLEKIALDRHMKVKPQERQPLMEAVAADLQDFKL